MTELQDLEKLYSPSCWSKRFPTSEEVLTAHIKVLEDNSKFVQDTIPCELNISYGPGLREKYDIYGTELREGTPLLIHIHGGYYQEKVITHTNNGFLSNILHQNEIRTILLGYELSPERTVSEILEHLQIGLRECIKYAKKVKTREIYLSGHSVGAHAIASILTDFKRAIQPEDSDLIKGAFLLCGLYDLTPITKMSANDSLKLSEDIVREELSPLFDKLDYGSTYVLVVAAENDSPAFVQQSKDFYDKLKREGMAAELLVVKEADHFDIVERLYEEKFELTQFIVNAIKGK